MQRPNKSPNIERLFSYLQKSQWHNVTSHFSGFVRKDFNESIETLDTDENEFVMLAKLIEHVEMGRFSEAKDMIDEATIEYQMLNSKIANLKKKELSPRRYTELSPRSQFDHSPRRPATEQLPSEQYHQARDTYTPGDQRAKVASPRQQENRDGHRTPLRTPMKATETQRYPTPGQTPNVQEMEHRHKQENRDGPRTPLRTPLRTPMKATEPQRYPTPGQTPNVEEMEHRHKQNYDSLRLSSPVKQPETYPVLPVQHAYDQHPTDQSPERDRGQHRVGSKQSQSSHDEIWGQDHGDKTSEKVGNSTYRMSYPKHELGNVTERTDKEMYRKNFGSLTERNAWARDRVNEDGGDKRRLDSGKSSKSSASSKNSMSSHKPLGTPDLSDPNRPSELARRFGDLYHNEWADAYDEICKDFGSEKTVRHLLWVVTEACLIANDVADRQFKGLEKTSYGLMTSPGSEYDAYLVCEDIAQHQLRHLEKASIALMTRPTTDKSKHSRVVQQNLGQAVPQSRPTLTKYRKQTSTLSVPYVKEECRTKICKTLYEASRFPSHFLTENSRLVAYVNACAELAWLMCVNDPPIIMEYITRETEGGRFNTEKYTFYSKAGTTYDYGVWPMLRVNKTVLAQGVAQGI